MIKSRFVFKNLSALFFFLFVSFSANAKNQCARLFENNFTQIQLPTDQNLTDLTMQLEAVTSSGLTPAQIMKTRLNFKSEIMGQQFLLQKALKKSPSLKKFIDLQNANLNTLNAKKLSLDQHFEASLKTLVLLHLAEVFTYKNHQDDMFRMRSLISELSIEKSALLEKYLTGKITATEFDQVFNINSFVNERFPIRLADIILAWESIRASKSIGPEGFPIFISAETPISSMNKVASPSLALVGLSADTMFVDGGVLTPLFFAIHDINHRDSYTNALRTKDFQNFVNDQQLAKILIEIRKEYLAAKNSIKNSSDQKKLDIVYFEAWHEFSYYLIESIRIELSQASEIERKDNAKRLHQQFYVNINRVHSSQEVDEIGLGTIQKIKSLSTKQDFEIYHKEIAKIEAALKPSLEILDQIVKKVLLTNVR